MGAGVVPVAGGVALAPSEGIAGEALVAQVPIEPVVVVPIKHRLMETASVAKGGEGGGGEAHAYISVLLLRYLTVMLCTGCG